MKNLEATRESKVAPIVPNMVTCQRETPESLYFIDLFGMFSVETRRRYCTEALQ